MSPPPLPRTRHPFGEQGLFRRESGTCSLRSMFTPESNAPANRLGATQLGLPLQRDHTLQHARGRPLQDLVGGTRCSDDANARRPARGEDNSHQDDEHDRHRDEPFLPHQWWGLVRHFTIVSRTLEMSSPRRSSHPRRRLSGNVGARRYGQSGGGGRPTLDEAASADLYADQPPDYAAPRLHLRGAEDRHDLTGHAELRTGSLPGLGSGGGFVWPEDPVFLLLHGTDITPEHQQASPIESRCSDTAHFSGRSARSIAAPSCRRTDPCPSESRRNATRGRSLYRRRGRWNMQASLAFDARVNEGLALG